ncbi:unnamed protein product, partial [Mesorhabditis spiculigera]
MAHAAEHAICLGLHRRKNIGTRMTPRGTTDIRTAEEYASALDAQTYETVIRIMQPNEKDREAQVEALTADLCTEIYGLERMKNGELRERGVMLLELKMNGPPSGCCQLYKKIASVVHPEAPELSYFSGGTAEALRSADEKNEITVDNEEDESGKRQGERFRLMQTWGISAVEKVGQMLDWVAERQNLNDSQFYRKQYCYA